MINVLYVRVSTDDQNCDLQLDACKKYCADRNLAFEIVQDKISGAKTTRPGFDSLMALVRTGKVARVICYKLDRLGRSLTHLAMVIEEFKANNTALVAVSQGLDTSTDSPVGNLQMHVLMAIAQFERSLITERVNAGIQAARSRGVKFGRKPKHGVTLQLVHDMRGRGLSINAIAKSTGVNKGTIHRMAKQQVTPIGVSAEK